MRLAYNNIALSSDVMRHKTEVNKVNEDHIL